MTVAFYLATRATYRVHILREPRSPDTARPGPKRWRDDDEPEVLLSACANATAVNRRRSQLVVLDPMPAEPPEGMEWCPSCIGHQSEAVGLLQEFAGRLAGGVQ